jgi:homoserine dehydrogenase
MRLDPRRIKLATTVYNVEEITLQNGAVVKLKPLTIKELRKFMQAIQRTGEATTEDETLDILIDAVAVALEKQQPELVANRDALEDALDVPTINRILEVCGGIKLDDPNLLAAAVLAGQN